MYSLLSADDYHIVFLIHINPGVANIRFSEIFKWIIGLRFAIMQNVIIIMLCKYSDFMLFYIFYKFNANVYIIRKRSCETHQNENWIAKVLNNIKRKQCGNRRYLVSWKAKTSNKLSTVTMDT